MENEGFLPIDGDLKGYLSGRSTLTFHTPPSYGAAREEKHELDTAQLRRGKTEPGKSISGIITAPPGGEISGQSSHGKSS